MTIHKHNPWLTRPQISGLIPLPDRGLSLFASSSGPARKSGEPIVIFFTGAGAPCASYVKVQEHLASFVRTLFFDRAGYDRSTLPSSTTTRDNDGDGGPLQLLAEDGARDLDALLRTIGVDPPYILVGHSFGGIPAREFLHLQLQLQLESRGHQEAGRAEGGEGEVEGGVSRVTHVTDVIAGMVLYDTATELVLGFYPRVPSVELVEISKDVDWEAVTHLREESGLSDEQWEYIIEAVERTGPRGAKREDTHGSARALAKKRQLERHAYKGGILSVVRCNSTMDYQRMYDEGLKLGAGTQEQRRLARRFVEDWGLYNCQMVRAQLDLVVRDGEEGDDDAEEDRDKARHASDAPQYVYHERWGHDSPLRKRELMGDPVRWVLEQWRKMKEEELG
jgi:pimeloyl-ACP methyl ester carboxylesterase